MHHSHCKPCRFISTPLPESSTTLLGRPSLACTERLLATTGLIIFLLLLSPILLPEVPLSHLVPHRASSSMRPPLRRALSALRVLQQELLERPGGRAQAGEHRGQRQEGPPIQPMLSPLLSLVPGSAKKGRRRRCVFRDALRILTTMVFTTHFCKMSFFSVFTLQCNSAPLLVQLCPFS